MTALANADRDRLMRLMLVMSRARCRTPSLEGRSKTKHTGRTP